MITYEITDEHRKLVENYAIKQTIGGLTNLSNQDISKASRKEFQHTGLFGEIAWHSYRYGNLNKLIAMLDRKFIELRPLRKGDDGEDDLLTFQGNTRKIDVKTSHSKFDTIDNLNLIVPAREYHQNMIYVAAYTLGGTRANPERVILAGWANNEMVTKEWRADEPGKKCVPVSELRNLSALKKKFNDPSASNS